MAVTWFINNVKGAEAVLRCGCPAPFRWNEMKTKILIVEDDPHILLGLEEVLKSDGFEVTVCNRGDQAVEAVGRHHPELIVLDVMLPGLSGYDVCKQLRGRRLTTPILMLTAKGQEIDKVVGLDLGADDYVTKPFGVRELLARIHALLRRIQPNGDHQANNDGSFQIGTSTIDPKTFQLHRGKSVEELTAKELKLLQLFHAHRGEVSPATVCLMKSGVTTTLAPREPWIRSSSSSAKNSGTTVANRNTS